MISFPPFSEHVKHTSLQVGKGVHLHKALLPSHRKKEPLPAATTWMDLWVLC